jgi:ABC-type sugar transport system permease subunit
MASITRPAENLENAGFTPRTSSWLYLLQLLALAVVDVFGLLLAIGIGGDGNLFLAIAIVLTLIVVNAIYLIPGLWPMRWMAAALALLILLAVYPLMYTIYVGFTNYSDGHSFTKVEAIELLGRRRYLPEGQVNYTWQPFVNDRGDYALWLFDQDGNAFFAKQGEPLQPVKANESGEGPYNDAGIPASLEGYNLLTGGARFQALSAVQGIIFGDENNPVGIQSLNQAGTFQPKWVYDSASDSLIDQETGTAYKSDDSKGEFVAPDGSTAPLGYWVFIGLENMNRIFSSSLTQGPLLRVFLWTVGFAAIGSLSSFAAGLMLALLLNGNANWLRYLRSAFIIPWAIPGMIGILIWRGMFNSNFGVISTTLKDIFGWAPPFSTDPGWAKFAVLLVNLWFAFPYFMLIASGALQSISPSIYEAAKVDGATRWVQFRQMTLPLVLVSLGPLLIASFIYNFNNFLLLEALFQGGPPMAGTSAPPVGHTDNLITYTFRLAFSTGGTRDFGLASALAILIFIIVGALTTVQFRLTGRWEEISESV